MKKKAELPRVLHIDDDQTFQDLFDALFQEELDIRAVQDGERALEMIKKTDFDIVITEYRLKDYDGIELLDKMRIMRPNLPIVFYTTESDQEIIRKAFIKGASDYFVKGYKYIAKNKILLNALSESIYRKKVEEALRECSIRFREIVEKAEAGYCYLDLEGRYEVVNDSFLEMFGYSSSDEIIGKYLSENIIQTYDTQISDIIERLQEGNAIETIELTRLCRDNSVKHHSFSAKPVRQDDKIVGMEGFLIDITEKKIVENTLKEREKSTGLIMESSNDTISIHDFQGKFLFYAAPKLSDINPEEMVGKYAQEIFRGKQVDCIIKQLKEAAESGKRSHCYRSETVGDKEKLYLDEVFPIVNAKNEVVSIGRISKDISRFKEINSELIDKNRELEQFTQKASHDMRSPLADIVLYLHLINERPSLFESLYPNVIAIANEMITLINELLNLAKAGKVIEEKEQINLRVLIEDIFNKHAKIQDSAEFVFIKPIFDIFADPIRISQVFANLIHNSFQNRNPEIGKLIIEIRCTKDEKYVNIFYKDNGTGIEEEKILKIFDLGFTTQERKGGSGFGLAMAKKIIEAHGGEISVRSEGRNKGSEFLIKLPNQ